METNNDGAFQVELVGTCSKNGPGIYWPEAPQWALDEVLLMMSRVEADRGIPHVQPSEGWLPYPDSYGNTRVRMSTKEWDDYAGWCGHQHVPYNDHGDPGDMSALFQEVDEMTPDDKAWIKQTIRSQVTYALRDDLLIPLSDDQRDRIYGNHDTSPTAWTITKAASYLSGQQPLIRKEVILARSIAEAQAAADHPLTPEDIAAVAQATSDALSDDFEVSGDVRLQKKTATPPPPA